MAAIKQQPWQPTNSQVEEIRQQRDKLLVEVARLRARPTEEEVALLIRHRGRYDDAKEVARAVLALFPKEAAMTDPMIADAIRIRNMMPGSPAAVMLQKLGTEVTRLREAIGLYRYGCLSRAELFKIAETWNGGDEAMTFPIPDEAVEAALARARSDEFDLVGDGGHFDMPPSKHWWMRGEPTLQFDNLDEAKAYAVHRQIRATLEAALPSALAAAKGFAANWQPIETAPKDGARVLLSVRYVAPTCEEVTIASYSDVCRQWQRDDSKTLSDFIIKGWMLLPAIRALRPPAAPAESEGMRAALEPFAAIGQWLFARPEVSDDEAVAEFSGINNYNIRLTRGHFKAAHRAFHTPPLSASEPAGSITEAQATKMIADGLKRPRPPFPAEPAGVPWKCKAQRTGVGANDPQDCDWPTCGCDPYADKVLNALAESGYTLVPDPALAGAQQHGHEGKKNG